MNSTTLEPMIMTAELEYECVDKDEKECQDCRDRFKCWTSRNLTLSIKHLEIRQDLSHHDEFELTAELPRCFKCGNMVGSKVTVHAETHGMNQLFKGFIVAHFIKAEGTAPMEITIKGARELF